MDGQQRLATTLILIAAIRDYLCNIGDSARCRVYEQQYLTTTDPDNLLQIARLNLNGLDNEFFYNHVLLSPQDSNRRTVTPGRSSHERIANAALLAEKRVRKIVDGRTEDAVAKLTVWRKFLEERARVIWIEVPDDNTAFVIFETMNDRGLQLSAADLLKNYLFALSLDRMAEVQQKWFSMVGTLDTVADKEILVTYVRHLWISTRQHATQKELYGAIKDKVKTQAEAIALSEDLSTNAVSYAALLNPTHDTWNQFAPSARRGISTLNLLGLEQVRPLLLSIVGNFSRSEVSSAFKLLVNCSVRFLISGGLGGGVVEQRYGSAAQDVRQKKINNTVELKVYLSKIVPSDTEFKTDFATARVSKSHLARYYLRSMERKLNKETDWQLVPLNEDTDVINLEHVMPYNSRTGKISVGWSHISADDHRAFFNRIGNLALMDSSSNSELGEAEYRTVKKPALKASEFVLTQEIGVHPNWSPKEITERQGKLAELAVKTWPIKI